MGLGFWDFFFKKFSKNIEKRHYVKSGAMTGKVNHKQNFKFEICSTWKKSRKFNLYFFLFFESENKNIETNLINRPKIIKSNQPTTTTTVRAQDQL